MIEARWGNKYIDRRRRDPNQDRRSRLDAFSKVKHTVYRLVRARSLSFCSRSTKESETDYVGQSCNKCPLIAQPENVARRKVEFSDSYRESNSTERKALLSSLILSEYKKQGTISSCQQVRKLSHSTRWRGCIPRSMKDS